MFFQNYTFYLEKLKNISLSDITKIELIYTYLPRDGRSIFHTSADKIEFKGRKGRFQELVAFARHLGFNKLAFYIFEDKAFLGADKVVCEKTDDASALEVTYYRPEAQRVSDPAGKSITLAVVAAILVTICIILLFIMLADLSEASNIGGKAILLLTIALPGLLLCAMGQYLVGYLKYFSGRRQEKRTFNVKNLSAEDYPEITITDKSFSYEKGGVETVLLWDSVLGLEHDWGRTLLYDNAGQAYPIPCYELISIISNKLLVASIIKYAGLVKDEKRSNYWAKTV